LYRKISDDIKGMNTCATYISRFVSQFRGKEDMGIKYAKNVLNNLLLSNRCRCLKGGRSGRDRIVTELKTTCVTSESHH
jgi:hypothetical protein